jgi:hypothetical protein
VAGFPQPGTLPAGLDPNLASALQALRAQSNTLKAGKESAEGRIGTAESQLAALPTRTARATVDVTTGAPGTVALVGAARGISAVSIESLTTPVNPTRVVRFMFTTAMPDTDYSVDPSFEYPTITARGFFIRTKATTHCEVGLFFTTGTFYANVDEFEHRFSVSVSR